MKRVWIILAVLLVIAYIISPIDILPDVFPLLGRLDDLFMLGLLVYYLKYQRLPGFVARLFGSRAPGGKFGTSRPFESRGGAGAVGGAKTASEDPYAILGVKPGATPEEIHAAYREAAQRYHPDKVAHLGEEFKEMAGRKFLEIQEAYDFLTGKGD